MLICKSNSFIQRIPHIKTRPRYELVQPAYGGVMALHRRYTVKKQPLVSDNSHTSSMDTDSPRYTETNTSSAFKLIPKVLHPYAYLARLDKPVGTNLLLIPCTWSIIMASYHQFGLGALTDSSHNQEVLLQTLSTLTLFTIGAFIMRGAGCTINDMWDRDFDQLVERTKPRPIASGKVSPRQAWIFLAAQLSCGLGILTQLNYDSIMLGAASLPFVAAYPLAKRLTNYPQFILGLTFNWGALLGWIAMTGGQYNWYVMAPLYCAGISWTLIYDTIYAHQDKHDDIRVGIKSTALTFGENTKTVLGRLNYLMSCSLMAAGFANEQLLPYYLCVLMANLYNQRLIKHVDLHKPESCASAFRSSQWAGWIITGGVFADLLYSFIA